MLCMTLAVQGQAKAKDVTHGYECVYSYFTPVSVLDVATNKQETKITFLWDTSQNGGRLNLDLSRSTFLAAKSGQDEEISKIYILSETRHPCYVKYRVGP